MSLSANKPLVLLACPAGKRVRLMQAARAALGLAPASVLAWRDWLACPALLDQALAHPCTFKIEPPGDDPEVHFRLLQDGHNALALDAPARPAHGELSAPAAWFAGLRRAMRQLEAQLAAFPTARAVNAPQDVLDMTDKLACQRRLFAHGVAVPALIGAVGGYDDLMRLLDGSRLDRVFIKARYGSSAAGVVAFRRNRRGGQQAITSAQLSCESGQARLYNNKQVCSYQKPGEIAALIDLLAEQDAYVEAWIPKPRLGAGHYDVRVVTLDGEPAHRVARVGKRMMTNLHLDNQRADVATLLDARDAAALDGCARQAAAVFPASRVIGFDIVVRHGAARVLEANAFGDLLPGLLHEGIDTYGAQLLRFAG